MFSVTYEACVCGGLLEWEELPRIFVLSSREYYQLRSTRVSSSWCICCGWQVEAVLS
jgi:hypothetical protein